MNRAFDIYIAVDWSAKSVPSAVKPSKDAIWIGQKDVKEESQIELYFRTRYECMEYLRSTLIESIKNKKRVLVGYDFDFGFPAGFIECLQVSGELPKWKQLWNLLSDLIKDDSTNQNNRFEVASYLNSLCTNERGPLWGHPVNKIYKSLYHKAPTYPFVTKKGNLLRKSRWTEMREPKAQPVWKLIGSASVGGQTLVGIPMLNKLRTDKELEFYSKIWPFETNFLPIITPENSPIILHLEIWPGIFSGQLDPDIAIKDQAQVRKTVDWMHECDLSGELMTLLSTPTDMTEEQIQDCLQEEGWVLGSGYFKYKNNSLF